jgi:hypothetical protein
VARRVSTARTRWPDGTAAQAINLYSDAANHFSRSLQVLAIDADGRLFAPAVAFSAVPPRGLIYVYGPDGALVAGWAWTGHFPTGITPDGAGNVYIADYDLSTVQKFRLLPTLAPRSGTPSA